MTTVLPKNEKEVNFIHSKIYGMNTIGAFLGVLICGFYAIPNFGLTKSLYFFGILNVLASVPYLLNLLDGKIKEKGQIEKVPHGYRDQSLYLYAFIVGPLPFLLRFYGFEFFASPLVVLPLSFLLFWEFLFFRWGSVLLP